MPKWVRKAQSLEITRKDMRHQIGTSALDHVITEAERAPADLQLVIDHTSFSARLTPDPAGLTLAETFCRDPQAWKERVESFPDEQVDRLIALFFGHVFTKDGRGNWVVYPGKYHVYHPVVIELAERRRHYIQPFLYCAHLRSKQLRGAHETQSLRLLYEQPEKSCTP